MRKFLAIIVGKILIKAIRLLKVGGGSALPGLLVEKIYPDILSGLSEGIFTKGIIVITGTNGKTTTAWIISNVLEKKGFKVLNNFTGSNLPRGIISSIIEKTDIRCRKKFDYGVFEVDEAATKTIIPILNPSAILVTNLFRDQLDRYGEIDKTASIIFEAINSNKNKKQTIILNGNDPLISSFSKKITVGKILFFGIKKADYSVESVIDMKYCPLCNKEMVFSTRFYGHLGNYLCTNCGFKTPEMDFYADGIEFKKTFSLSFKIHIKERLDIYEINPMLFGFFNIFNITAAFSMLSFLNVDPDFIKKSIEITKFVFGRMEKFESEGKNIMILLGKNPVGFAEDINVVDFDKNKKTYLIILNDNFADGTDISWIWDVPFEKINKESLVISSGIRAADMALRLKYAQLSEKNLKIINEIPLAFQESLKLTQKGGTVYILPTYSAMLELRKYLIKKGIIKGKGLYKI